jgi:class 3 adenylate cyclase
VGYTVNLASRLQGLTREIRTEMIVSAATFEKLASEDLTQAQLKKLEPVHVKKRQTPVETYALEAI